MEIQTKQLDTQRPALSSFYLSIMSDLFFNKPV